MQEGPEPSVSPSPPPPHTHTHCAGWHKPVCRCRCTRCVCVQSSCVCCSDAHTRVCQRTQIHACVCTNSSVHADTHMLECSTPAGTQPSHHVPPGTGTRSHARLCPRRARVSTHLHHTRAHACPRLAHGGTQAHACSRGVQAGACPQCPSSHTQAAGTEPPRARLTNTPTTRACACTDTHEAACGAQRGWGCQTWGGGSPHS